LNVEDFTVERVCIVFGFSDSEEKVLRGHEMNGILPGFGYNDIGTKSSITKSITGGSTVSEIYKGPGGIKIGIVFNTDILVPVWFSLIICVC